MSSPTQIWTCAAFLPIYRCGGWANLVRRQGQLSGIAGGERNTTTSRIALTGLAAALRHLQSSGAAPSGGPIDILTTSPELARFADVLGGLGTPAQTVKPEDDLDLWAQIVIAAAGRRLIVVQTSHAPGTPMAFTTAWAELARDKAKASGPFTAAIPKPNLTKVPGQDLK